MGIYSPHAAARNSVRRLPGMVLQTVERAISGQMVNETPRKLPLVFEPNLGQADVRARFLTRARGLMSHLMTSTGSIRLYRASRSSIGKLTRDTARWASYLILPGKVAFALAEWGPQARFGDRSIAGYATYLSGSDMCRASSLAANSTGAAYVTGHTNSTNFPTTTSTYQTGARQIEIPVAARTITAWTIPLSAQLDARRSQERLCNGF